VIVTGRCSTVTDFTFDQDDVTEVWIEQRACALTDLMPGLE
jgi:hypothetical protein